jgi:gamma-glutamyl hercynylcysteine S-oxide synthase
MVRIPAGEFVMGTDLERADPQDKPQHRVTLPVYYLDKYLVTNAQYARFVAATRRRPPSTWKDGRIPQGEAMLPVTMVTWDDASAYALWAGKRLPHETELEKAGRGTDGRRWPWGNSMDPSRLNTYLNVGSPSSVTAYPQGASVYGVFDLSGNVAEWTLDDLLPYTGAPAPPAAQAPVGRNYKVLRGGSWKGDPLSTSLYHRDYSFPSHATDFYGFRCASDAQHAVREQR